MDRGYKQALVILLTVQDQEEIMSVAEKIKEILEINLEPEVLEIKDMSDRHIGHAGHDGRGESHFKLDIVSRKFEGLTRLERHRMIHDLLGDLLKSRVHALSIKAQTPHEQL